MSTNIDAPPSNLLTVAIIGAGLGGLIAVKECLSHGLQPVCFELAKDVGGLWNATQPDLVYKARLYDSLVVNISKERMGLSDFPIPEDYPQYLPHSLVHEYLKAYAVHFNLLKYIALSTMVQTVRKRPADGRWELVTCKVDSAGQPTGMPANTIVADRVIVSSGKHWKPKMPILSGIKSFQGSVMHSRDYTRPEDFRGKRVVILGFGNSATDIAVELSSIASSVTISARKSPMLMPRVTTYGKPTDHLASRVSQQVPKWLKRKIFANLSAQYTGDIRRFNLEATDPLGGLFTVNGDLVGRLITGKVKIAPGVQSLSNDAVTFADGTMAACDILIMCTGFELEYPFLDRSIFRESFDSWSIHLYHKVVPPADPTIGFSGLVLALGGQFLLNEMQVRWIVAMFANKIQLPSPEDMELAIAKDHSYIRRQFRNGADQTQAEFFPYVGTLARDLGCTPKFWKTAWRHSFKLALQVHLGVQTPSQYRLFGMGAWSEAAVDIAKVAGDVGTRRKQAPVPKKSSRKRDGVFALGFDMDFAEHTVVLHPSKS
ncbi:flavin-containing monooxygenase [Geranomyces michiganensis]|nr:flavin-containing monooxygenase [Geranomyces michiganensis]